MTRLSGPDQKLALPLCGLRCVGLGSPTCLNPPKPGIYKLVVTPSALRDPDPVQHFIIAQEQMT